jgi:general stress protein CsbA
MLDAILFVIVGLVFFWLLAAIFEAIGFTKHRYVARGLAALLTIAGACVGTGYQHWWEVLIGIGAAFLYLQVLRKSPEESGQESK